MIRILPATRKKELQQITIPAKYRKNSNNTSMFARSDEGGRVLETPSRPLSCSKRKKATDRSQRLVIFIMSKQFEVLADASYSYDGETLEYVDDETVMYICGNGLKFVSSRLGQQSFMWARQTGGVSVAASHPKSKRFAYTNRVANPAIYVHSYPDYSLVATLRGGTDLEYAAMSFSMDGVLLAAIGKLTDFKFAVWNIEGECLLKGVENTLPVPCSFVSFNPVNPYQLCTGGDKGMCFWALNRSYDVFELVPTRGVIASGPNVDTEDDTLEEDEDLDEESPRNQFICHCWSAEGQVYASNMTGELLKFSVETGIILESISVGGGGLVNAMLMMKEHLIVGGVDGVLRWLVLPGHGVEQSATVATRKGEDREALSIRRLSPNVNYDRIAVGTAQGRFVGLT
jgi:hypothetical protein